MEFNATLEAYRERWQALDAPGIVAYFASEYEGSYAHTLNQVDRNILADALAGWRGAFDELRTVPCRWEFEDLAIREIAPNGRLVIGWLRLYMNEKMVGETYRMEVWRQQGDEWRLLRDHQEYNLA